MPRQPRKTSEQKRNRYLFCKHRCHAYERGIEWELTYEDWLHIWQASGHFDDRGCCNGQYVMSRYGDIGPYAAYNVRIVPMEQNLSEIPRRGMRIGVSKK